MLKLIINNTHAPNESLLPLGLDPKPVSLNDSFLFDFQEFSPNLYVFMAKDYTHELLCKMNLEVSKILTPLEEEGKRGECLAPVVTCNFPSLSLEKINEKTGFDGYLQELLLGQFYLKILEQLLLFCEAKNAVYLTLTMSDTDLGYLKFYRCFLVSEEQVATSKGEEIQVMISADLETYDSIIDFMDKVNREFRCALWRGHYINPALRDYLISNARL